MFFACESAYFHVKLRLTLMKTPSHPKNLGTTKSLNMDSGNCHRNYDNKSFTILILPYSSNRPNKNKGSHIYVILCQTRPSLYQSKKLLFHLPPYKAAWIP